MRAEIQEHAKDPATHQISVAGGGFKADPGGVCSTSCSPCLFIAFIATFFLLSSPSQQTDKPEDVLVSQEELQSRLWQTFSQMEQELVKLVTLVRSRKARLAARHRSCKASECQEDKESTLKPFNLAVYDIVEED
ncbi:uncharacterized protein LOC140702841 [Pogona vitticeps]